MAPVEQFAEQPSTVVSSGGTTNSDTSFTVASPSAFPQASNSATPPTQFHIVDANPVKQSEIMTVTNVSGSTWTVTRGANGTTAVAHNAGWTAVQVTTGGWLGTVTGQYFGYPWQFYPENYGAKGDGTVFTVNTTAANTTITATSAVFTSTVADGGKYIMIHGANGTTSGPLITTISSVTDSTHAVVAAAPSATVSACPAVFGTDDVAAISNCLTAAANYATANQYFAEVVFGGKIYVLGTGPTQTGNGATTPTFNAQIPLPYPNANGTTRKLILALTGAGDNGYCQYWESLIPNVAGTALVSMTTAPSTPSGTFGNQSVIGGPSGSAGFTGGYANLKVVVKGIGVWCSIYTNQYAYDFGFVSAMRVVQSSAQIFAPTGVNGGVQPYLNAVTATAFTNSIGTGFRTPVGGNNDDVTMDDVNVEGYECAYRAWDHFNAGRLAAIYSDVVMYNNSTQNVAGSTSHGIFIQSMSAEVYNGGLLSNGGSCQVNINWDAEGTPSAYDVNDGTAFFGIFRFGDKIDNRAPVVTNGAANLKIINENLGPGHWSGAPAVPASTTAQQNTAWRDASIVVHTGAGVTVSAISVDGTSTGLTMAASSSLVLPVVPGGKTVTLTYAGGTPTWDWWLM